MNNDMQVTIIAELSKRYDKARKIIKRKKWDPDRQGADAPNILFVVKEADIEDINSLISRWAVENNINLVEITASNGMISKHQEFATEGYLTQSYISISKENFELFNRPNTIIYFKRIDLVQEELLRRIMLKFMNNQSVTLGDGKVYFAKNILFSVLTISDTMDKDARRTLIQDSKDGFVRTYLYEEV